MSPLTPDAGGEQETADLERRLALLEKAAVPLRAELDRLRQEAEGVRSQLRRRERGDSLATRQKARAEMASGQVPSLEDVVSGAVVGYDSALLDDLRFMRESATEVRLGYASASRQSLSFTDGAGTEEAFDIAAARDLWQRGWEWGSPAAKGVRIYPQGSRAERVVPASEIHVEARPEH